ncbi:17489_t:CDS:2 [Gigaspora margarita]|uniref:17489_t:CDS:1 n=1 Tax=Gigaspora margarita TaxID=4874 RepID=A0ABN7VY33_GIGMA|nr:17489_t:CDS:2 [Gigaspora margarita]
MKNKQKKLDSKYWNVSKSLITRDECSVDEYNCTSSCLLAEQGPRQQPTCYVLKPGLNETLNGLELAGLNGHYYTGWDLKTSGRNLTMYPELCIAYCADYAFKYAALSNGSECRCGNDITAYTNDSNCNMNCPANAVNYFSNTTDNCGGKNSYSIYETIISDPYNHYNYTNVTNVNDVNEKVNIVHDPKKYVDSRYLYCIPDHPHCNKRIFTGTFKDDGTQIKETSNMTVDYCIDKCRESGYNNAGLEAGTQCFCANASSYTLNRLSSEYCSSSCAGNSSQTCGGLWTIRVIIIALVVFIAIICIVVIRRKRNNVNNTSNAGNGNENNNITGNPSRTSDAGNESEHNNITSGAREQLY